MQTWQLQEAKAKFSALMRAAKKAPQMITVRGEEEAVLLSREEYNRIAGGGRKMTLTEFFRNSPLYGLELDLERDKSPPRDINLFEE